MRGDSVAARTLKMAGVARMRLPVLVAVAATLVAFWALALAVNGGNKQPECRADKPCVGERVSSSELLKTVTKPALAVQPRHHVHMQDLVAMLIAVCTVFCSMLAFVILKKPVPRLLDTIPREALCWAHCDNLFIFTDLESDSIMIKNAGPVDIDMSGCKVKVEHSRDRGIYYSFSFPEGYLLVAGTTVCVCYRAAAKFVMVPRKRAERLDSRKCPRLRWPPHEDGPVDSALDNAVLFDFDGNQIACESAILQPAISTSNLERRLSTDSSDASFLFAGQDEPLARLTSEWY